LYWGACVWSGSWILLVFEAKESCMRKSLYFLYVLIFWAPIFMCAVSRVDFYMLECQLWFSSFVATPCFNQLWLRSTHKFCFSFSTSSKIVLSRAHLEMTTFFHARISAWFSSFIYYNLCQQVVLHKHCYRFCFSSQKWTKMSSACNNILCRGRKVPWGGR
jgi:hypothetical protein